MINAEPMTVLRQRTSEKWTAYPPDVLPMFVAEMDFELAPAICVALTNAVEIGDTGYLGTTDTRAADAFVDFASTNWGWQPDPTRIRTTTDVSVVIVESLRRLITPGDGVVITPPVYPPFFDLVPEAGGTVVEVPLLDDGSQYLLDLDGIDQALAADAKTVLLCHPHNPLGLVHSRETLIELSRIVDRHGASVLSDEIHAPLTHRDVEFTPYLTVSPEAADHGLAAHSGSKAFNLAGLKCAFFVAESERMQRLVGDLPEEVSFRTGLLGAIATAEGFAHGREWLREAIRRIESNSALLESLLAEHLPSVQFRRPHASYLAWLDMRELGWGDDPAAYALEHAKVALSSGPAFGRPGSGFARMNLACAPETISVAVHRLTAAHSVAS